VKLSRREKALRIDCVLSKHYMVLKVCEKHFQTAEGAKEPSSCSQPNKGV